MIRHILLIKFTDSVTPEQIEQVEALFDAIPSKVEGVVSTEWGVNNSPEHKNQGYTHSVFMSFADEAGRHEGDELSYNAVAMKLAKQHHLAINDLHTLTANMNKNMFSAKGDVHFTAAGYKTLAVQVTDSIKSQITQ